MTKTPRQTAVRRDTSIEDGVLYFEDVRQAAIDTEQFSDIVGDGYTRTIRVVSLSSVWVSREWIAGVGSTDFSINVEMTLRRELRSGRGHWYAYRRKGGLLQKRYVGQDDKITSKRIVEVAQKML